MNITDENALTGAPSSEWTIQSAGDPNNLGFCREFSGNVGTTLNFSCHGAGTQIDIYRIGYYQGLGWRKVATITNTPTQQPNPTTVAGTNQGISCTNWSTTATYQIPQDATTGLYVGVYRNVAKNNASYIPFVIRDDSLDADIIIKTSDTTWALAYNHYNTPASPFNGKSVYGSNGTLSDPENRAHFGSYHRPIVTRQNVPQTYWLNAEAPLIRYVERNGYNVKYVSSKDLDENPSILERAKIFISSGHDEYWSDNMRNAVTAFRDSGKHAIFMSGNEVFWRIRFNEARTGMYCYKDTMPGPGSHAAGTALDPVSWTGTWKDTRWAGRKPENTLTGTDFRMNGVNQRALTVSSSSPFAGHPVWRNANLSSPVTMSNIVGFEADSMLPVRLVPHAVILAGQSYELKGIYANDNGQNYDGDGTLNWGIVAQRYASGAVVVGFGTVQFAWTLDAVHDRDNTAVTVQGQQFMMNLLTDLGATASSPQGNLVLSSPESLNYYGITGTPVVDDTATGFNGQKYSLYTMVNGVMTSVKLRFE